MGAPALALRRLGGLCAAAVLAAGIGGGLAGCEDFRAQQLLTKATELGSQGKWTEAIHYYERLWVQFPRHKLVDQARLKAARIYAGPENKLRSAEDLYRDLIVKARNEEIRVTALLELADLYAQRDGEVDQAIEVLEVYLQRFPDHSGHPEAAMRLAELYLKRGRLFQAIQEATPFRDAVDPEVAARSLLVTAQARELAKYAGDANADYAQVLSLTTQGTEAWVLAQEGLARTLEETGQWRLALDVLKRLRSHHPNPDAMERWIVAISERHEEMNR